MIRVLTVTRHGAAASAAHSSVTRCFCAPITSFRWDALGQP